MPTHPKRDITNVMDILKQAFNKLVAVNTWLTINDTTNTNVELRIIRILFWGAI